MHPTGIIMIFHRQKNCCNSDGHYMNRAIPGSWIHLQSFSLCRPSWLAINCTVGLTDKPETASENSHRHVVKSNAVKIGTEYICLCSTFRPQKKKNFFSNFLSSILISKKRQNNNDSTFVSVFLFYVDVQIIPLRPYLSIS